MAIAGQRRRAAAVAVNCVAPVKEKTDFKIAYISAGSALLGALIGAIASYFVAAHQLTVQGDQTRNDFLRTQRQAAYSRFSSDVILLRGNLKLDLPLIYGSDVAAQKAGNSDNPKLSDEGKTVTLDYANLILISTPGAATAADLAMNSLNSLIDAAREKGACLAGAASSCSMAPAGYSTQLSISLQQLNSFLKTARTDLGES